MNVKPRRRKKRKGGGFSWSTYWTTRTPSALILTTLSDTSIQLDWTNTGTGFDGHKVEISTDNVNFTVIATIAFGTNTYTDTGLTANTVYYYRVRAYKDVNTSDGIDDNGVTYNEEIGVYITGLTTPLSSAQKTKLNTMITGLKTYFSIEDLSEVFDFLDIIGGETQESSLRNLVKNAHHATLVNAPTFTQYEGIRGNGTDQYIDSNYNPSTQAVNYALNSATIGCYVRIVHDAGNGVLFGSQDATYYNRCLPRRVADSEQVALNSEVVSLGINNELTTPAIVTNVRPNATQIIQYFNSTATTIASNSTGIPNLDIFFLSLNGTAFYSNAQLSIIYGARAFSAADVAAVNTIFEAYMDSNGKGVL